MPDTQTILLVDDDDDVVRGMKLRFETAGYRTILANSAASATVSARTLQPQAIVMDVCMKDGSGLEVIEELKNDRETQHIPIVMLSGCISSQQRALDNGARFFLRKPYKGNEVLAAVETAIEESHLALLATNYE